ncbi:MAG: Na-Ca exchanger/integrin-beta4, partial [Hydrococcus sp. RM1_1_31]|nr:Na-Ca exchanger/integrin-beta4 [Hydrococcus sp. RM1_1_31]
MENNGEVTTLFGWNDYVYLSEDTILDSSDIYVPFEETGQTILSLAPGESYTVTGRLNLPKTVVGSRYLLFKTDGSNYLPETNETDNLAALPIEIKASNLSVFNFNAPSLANLGDTVQISWTVGNIGEIAASYGWNDEIYLSDDAILDNSDILIGISETSQHIPLAPGENYTITRSLAIPETQIGDRYLLLKANGNNNQPETNRADNLRAIPIKLKALDVDLAVSSISTPVEAFATGEVEIVWKVTNEGSDTATGTWTDCLYLSNDATIEQDELYGAFSFTGTIGAGETIERRQKITLPKSLTGQQWAIIKTDAANQLIEYGKEGNNVTVASAPINVLVPTRPNLQVNSITAPATAFSSQKTTLSWTVTNTGIGATNAPVWYDRVWLSLDGTLDGSDIYLGQAINPSYLKTGESYNNSLAVTLPQGIDGNYRFLVKTDFDNKIDEWDSEGDNLGIGETTRIELTPPPDLKVTSINAPSQAFSGQWVNLAWTVANAGAGRTLEWNWYDNIYLSANAVWDASDALLDRQYHVGILNSGESYSTTRNVILPVGISGDFYFIVRTDAGNQVYESAFDANNTGVETAPTKVNLTPPPDLEVELVEAPATALASHTFTINYRVANYGATATPNGIWLDSFYLSADDRFDPSTDLLLGHRTHYGVLEAGAALDKSATFTLPNGINGNYYLFVANDSQNAVFELDNNNNIGRKAQIINIASRPADLEISAVNAPQIAEAGKAMSISWTVSNQGTGDTAVTNWIDRIIASTDAVVGNGDDIILGSFSRKGLLNAGEAYTRTELVALPFNLIGNYNFFVVTDVDKQVYEAVNEANNISSPLSVTVTRQTPDLQVAEVSTTTSALSGQSLTVNWNVKNFGTGRTNTDFWYDEVFLSPDKDLADNNNISLGRVYHSGTLAPLASYNGSGTFKLPIDLQGQYYALVRSDSPNEKGQDRVIESPLENNNDGVTTNPITINLGAVPDLALERIDAPNVGISGQRLDLNWTVRNKGAEITGRWREVFYLSRDQVFDRNDDIYLGYLDQVDNLASRESYDKSASFLIPRGLSGRYYVFGVTDSNDTIYERGSEANNLNYDPYSIEISIPSPADMAVDKINLSTTSGKAGDYLFIDYSIKDLGINRALGNWTDAIYLSADETWDLSDTLLGKVEIARPLAFGDGYSTQTVVQLPGALPGNYHILVRSDVRDQILEGNENNNISASAQVISLDVDTLELNVAKNGTLRENQSIYYRIDVPEGETLQVTFDSAKEGAFNELYVSNGQMPSQKAFDFGFESVSADQKIVVPLTQAGTYYIQARGQYVPGWQQDYAIKVETIDFGITKIGQTVGDKKGTITFEIEGAKFTPYLTAYLENAVGQKIEAKSIWYEDSTSVFATFDLKGAAIGA